MVVSRGRRRRSARSGALGTTAIRTSALHGRTTGRPGQVRRRKEEEPSYKHAPVRGRVARNSRLGVGREVVAQVPERDPLGDEGEGAKQQDGTVDSHNVGQVLQLV